MSDDKIAEIRERHERGRRAMLPLTGYAEAHTDRATLLAEVERLRKALQDIAEDCEDDYPPSHGAIKYAVQDALRGKP